MSADEIVLLRRYILERSPENLVSLLKSLGIDDDELILNRMKTALDIILSLREIYSPYIEICQSRESLQEEVLKIELYDRVRSFYVNLPEIRHLVSYEDIVEFMERVAESGMYEDLVVVLNAEGCFGLKEREEVVEEYKQRIFRGLYESYNRTLEKMGDKVLGEIMEDMRKVVDEIYYYSDINIFNEFVE